MTTSMRQKVRWMLGMSKIHTNTATTRGMCLIAFDWRPPPYASATGDEERPRPSLLLVANRDEYYRRPSQTASFWKPNSDHETPSNDGPNDYQHKIYAGRDLEQGGSWLACSSNRRFATITNFRSPHDRDRQFPRSRGEIVSLFVSGKSACNDSGENDDDATEAWSARDFVVHYLFDKLDDYAGFSALLCDGRTLICCTNRGNIHAGSSECGWFRELPAGLYGLSNHLLDTPWPKVIEAKLLIAQARKALSESENKFYSGSLDEKVLEQLLLGFGNSNVLEDPNPEATTLEGIEVVIQRAVCVRLKDWGTRTTTVVCYDDTVGYEFIEKNYETPFDQPSWSREVIPLNLNDTGKFKGRSYPPREWPKSIHHGASTLDHA